MRPNEHDSPPTSDGVFYSATDSATLYWYHYWSPQVGYIQTTGSGSGHWNDHLDHSQYGNYLNSESSVHPLTTWNSLNQEQVNYHDVGGNTGQSPPHISPDSVLQNPIDQGYRHHEPFYSSWAPEVTNFSQTGVQSRRPSYYSDPGLPTNFSDNATHQALTGHRPNTRPSVFTTSSADGHGVDRTNAPPADPSHSTDAFTYAGPSCSTSTSPVDELADRPVIRCYDHGCDGRTFSSISNFRRHQRERAGQGPVCFCPRCGASFYRRWTRDHHVERGSCLRLPRWH